MFQNIVGNDAPWFRVDLAEATLTLGRVRPVEQWDGPFTVIAYADITVDFGRFRADGWVGRSHSLWYCDAQEQGRYAWYELAFMHSTLSNARSAHEPYACSPHESEYALRNVIGGKQIAWPVTEIDRADPIEFINRWTGWFADAATGKLRRPAQMPERRAEGTWRRQDSARSVGERTRHVNWRRRRWRWRELPLDPGAAPRDARISLGSG